MHAWLYAMIDGREDRQMDELVNVWMARTLVRAHVSSSYVDLCSSMTIWVSQCVACQWYCAHQEIMSLSMYSTVHEWAMSACQSKTACLCEANLSESVWINESSTNPMNTYPSLPKCMQKYAACIETVCMCTVHVFMSASVFVCVCV